MELFTDAGNTQALKILVAVYIKDLNIAIKIVNSDVRILEYMTTAGLPVLKISDGHHLFSSNAACRYVLGQCGQGDVGDKEESLLEWEAAYLKPAVHHLLVAKATQSKNTPKLLETCKPLLGNVQQILSTLAAGEGLKKYDSAVTIAVWSSLYTLFCIDSPFKVLREEFGTVTSWFDSLCVDAAYKKALDKLLPGPGQQWQCIKASLLAQPVPPNIDQVTSEMQSPSSLSKEKTPKQSTSSEPESSSGSPSVSPEELANARDAWLSGKSRAEKPRKLPNPVLPEEGQRNVLITSALPYVNNVPHLGNIIGCVLSADVYARFCRLRNYTTLYVCGTDEYGTATETKAVEEGLTPQQICDKYNALHTDIYKWFNIGFDYFGRTTTQQQTQVAQDIFWKLHKNGYILTDNVEQLQCTKCDRFLADRFVEGTCPFCAYEDARGDQCDKCGKLINAIELREPRCKLCQNTPIVRSSEHLFLDLPKLEPLLVKHLDESFEKGIWSSNTKVITKSWIRDGLHARCITRDLKWGTPVPLEGFTDKVFYVWYDAPIGYISITANYTDQWEKWWKNPQQVELFNFMAKDNVPFHSVIFPSCQLGTGDAYTVVGNLSATEYLNYEDGKFSKSRGVGVFGSDAQNTGIPADVWRFYLLYMRPEGHDSAFSWDDFLLKNNSELLNNLGNFINRALAFLSNNFGGVMPAIDLTEADTQLLALATRELQSYLANLEKLKLRDGIRMIMNISRLGNLYMQENKPWVLVKGTPQEKARAGSVVGLAANLACLLSVLLQPYMPTVSQTIQEQLNAPADCNVLTSGQLYCYLEEGHALGTPKPLFQKIETKTVEDLKKRFAGQQGGDKAKQQKGGKPAPSAASQPTASPEEIEKLTQQVAQQGDVVRQLKAQKADQDKITAAVGRLLALKKELSLAQGGDPSQQSQGAGKKKKGKPSAPAKAPSPQAAPQPTASPEEIEKLTQKVAQQGDIVRQLKTQKADQDKITAEVGRLLSLKRDLCLAQGKDPDQQQQGAGKRKGKKK